MVDIDIYHGYREGCETFDLWVNTSKIMTAYWDHDKWWVQVLTNPVTPWFVQCNPKTSSEVQALIHKLLPFILKSRDQPTLDLSNDIDYLAILEQYS